MVHPYHVSTIHDARGNSGHGPRIPLVGRPIQDMTDEGLV